MSDAPDSLLAQVRVVLYEPQDPINIGATVRAMKNMGVRDLLEWAERGPVALLFGREDHGLPNEALDRSHLMVTIPTSTHASLNLAQAVLVSLYELHVTAGDATRRMGRHRKHAPAATADQLELTYADAERSLVALDFFRTRNPEHVMRSLRSMLSRAAPDAREIELVRAMTIEVRRTLDRVRLELGGQPVESPPARTRGADSDDA